MLLRRSLGRLGGSRFCLALRCKDQHRCSASHHDDQSGVEKGGDLAQLPGAARVDAATGSYCGTGSADAFGCEPGDLLLGPDTSDRYAAFDADGGTYLSVVPSVEPPSTMICSIFSTPCASTLAIASASITARFRLAVMMLNPGAAKALNS